MNNREAWAWSTVARAVTEGPMTSVQDWIDLDEAIDVLDEAAYKAFKRSGDSKFAPHMRLVPSMTSDRLDELLRQAST